MTESNATTTVARLAVAAGIAGTATLFSIVPASAVPADGGLLEEVHQDPPEGDDWSVVDHGVGRGHPGSRRR
jgi:hypothetical protein